MGLLQDLRYGARKLRERPAFALAAIVTLALGTGANTAVFTAVDAALLRPQPFPEPQRLVVVEETRQREELDRLPLSYPTFADYRTKARSFAGLAAYSGTAAVMALPGGATPVRGGQLSDGFFEALGVRPALGRWLEPSDLKAGAGRVVVLTDALWRRRLGGDAAILGRSLLLGGESFQVVGVLPPSFNFPLLPQAELFTAIQTGAAFVQRRNLHWLRALGRLAPGATIESAQRELTQLEHGLEAEYPTYYAKGAAAVDSLQGQAVGPIEPILLALLAAVALVLLIACANVANLMLAQAAGRRQEMAVRQALGASRGRLIAQLLTESALLGLCGGALGLLCAQWTLSALIAAMPDEQRAMIPSLLHLSIDGRALAFTFAISLGTGLLFGLFPALQASQLQLHGALQEEARSSEGRGRGSLRRALVVAEMALALLALSGAALVSRSLFALLRVDPGFRPEKLVAAQVELPSKPGVDDDALVLALHERLLLRLRGLPGVRSVASTNILPLQSEGNTIRFYPEGRAPTTPGTEAEANIRTASPGYFATMGIPLLAGRAFGPEDVPPRKTVIISQTFARRSFPNEDPVGKRIVFTYQANLPPLEIVGVVGDVKPGSPDQRDAQLLYQPHTESVGADVAVVVRTEGEPAALRGSVRAEIAAVSRDIAIGDVATMEQLIDRAPWLFVRRYPALLLSGFAALALLLSVVGVYGVLSTTVSQRRREIGIRVALGAQGRDIRRLVLGQAAGLALGGVLLGAALSISLTRLLRSLLFGVSATDPLVLLAAASLLLAVTLIAAWLPARRAARTDALQALK